MQRHCIEILLRSCQEAPLQRSWQETSYRSLLQRSCQDTSSGDLVQKHCTDLLQRSCHLPRVLLHKSCKNAFIESLYTNIIKRFCREISYRYLVQRSCQETSSRDLCKERALIEILYRDLARAYGGDLAQRPGEESRGLARRSCIDSHTQGS